MKNCCRPSRRGASRNPLTGEKRVSESRVAPRVGVRVEIAGRAEDLAAGGVAPRVGARVEIID